MNLWIKMYSMIYIFGFLFLGGGDGGGSEILLMFWKHNFWRKLNSAPNLNVKIFMKQGKLIKKNLALKWKFSYMIISLRLERSRTQTNFYMNDCCRFHLESALDTKNIYFNHRQIFIFHQTFNNIRHFPQRLFNCQKIEVSVVSRI